LNQQISPGTIDRYIRPLIEAKGFNIGEDIHLAHAPERIIPGNMVYELETHSRTIGADDSQVAERLKPSIHRFVKVRFHNYYKNSRNDKGSREYIPRYKYRLCQ
jgi:UDP-N-acetyl-D-mannosaminuronic acid dehydrogenase